MSLYRVSQVRELHIILGLTRDEARAGRVLRRLTELRDYLARVTRLSPASASCGTDSWMAKRGSQYMADNIMDVGV